MPLENTTPTPNEFFSQMDNLTDHEIRFLLLVIRQTFGWIRKDKTRKQKDRMTYGYISKKTGLYRSCLSTTIQNLINKNLLIVTDDNGFVLDTSDKRKGKRCLYYEYVRTQYSFNSDTTCLQFQTGHVSNSEHNKRKTYQKETEQKKEISATDYKRYKHYLEDIGWQ